MKKFVVEILPEARQDLLEITSYIANDNVDAAQNMLNSLIKRIEALAEFPESGALVPDLIRMTKMEIRRICVRPYSILYTFHNDRVLIYRVIHQRRDIELSEVMMRFVSNHHREN